MLTRRSPAVGQVAGPAAASVAPLVVSARSTPSAGQLARPASGRWARTVGSPPVRRIESMPKRSTQHPGDPLDLLEGEQLVPGQPLHALLGHAVGAAEVAAVGDRDPQVAVDAPERVDERRRDHRHRQAHGRPAQRSTLSGQEQHVDRRRRPRRRRRRAARPGRRPRPWRRAGAMPWPPAERDLAARRRRRRSATHPDEVDLAVGPAAAGRRRPRPAPRGRSSVGVARHPAQGRAGEQLEATPATTPGCRAGRTPGVPSTQRRRRTAWPAGSRSASSACRRCGRAPPSRSRCRP